MLAVEGWLPSIPILKTPSALNISRLEQQADSIRMGI